MGIWGPGTFACHFWYIMNLFVIRLFVILGVLFVYFMDVSSLKRKPTSENEGLSYQACVYEIINSTIVPALGSFLYREFG